MNDVLTQDKFFVTYSRVYGQILNVHPSLDEAREVANILAIGNPGDEFFILESIWLIRAAPPTAIHTQIDAVPCEAEQPAEWSTQLTWKYDSDRGRWTAVSQFLKQGGEPYTWVFTMISGWGRYVVIDGPSVWSRKANQFKTKECAMEYCQSVEDRITGPMSKLMEE